MMKNFFFLAGLLLIAVFSYSQDYSKEFVTLLNKGRTLNQAGDYKNAAIAYSSAIRIGGNLVTNNNRWTMACYWMRAKLPDSSFEQLNSIAGLKTVTFGFVEDVLTDDECFSSIHNDQRWKDVKEKMFLNAYQNYVAALKEAVGETVSSVTNKRVIALALGNKDDSALFHLNDPAYTFIKKKMYDKACRYVRVSINHFPQHYWLNRNMGDCYKAIGDKERAFTYYSRALNNKYRNFFEHPDTSINVVSAILTDYNQLSKEYDRKAIPSDLLLFITANQFLQKGKVDDAYSLAKMNIENYPTSGRANRSMSNYYNNIGNKQKAEEYFRKALMVENNLPENFFDSSFNATEFIISKYENISMQRSGRVLPPEWVVNNLANRFVANRVFKNAEQLYKLNITNYPFSPSVYSNISGYYKATGDKEKEEAFKRQSEELRKNPIPQPPPQGEVIPDTTYDIRVVKPACTTGCPVIWFDEAHNNYHTASWRYKPLANLYLSDGFHVAKGKTPITKETLEKVNVVIIAAPGPMLVDEIKILNEWIKRGGSLLTVTDHGNFGFDGLLESLGVQTPETEYTEDSLNARVMEDGIAKNPRHIVFSEKNKTLGEHSIINGRNASEKIQVVKTFSGRTIIAPPGSSVLLRLNESAVDYLTIETGLRTVETSVAVKCKGERVYGVAFNFGKGKVVVLSEAAMLTAQIWIDGTPGAGMNVPGSDNKQFALNIMRWLTGYLK